MDGGPAEPSGTHHPQPAQDQGEQGSWPATCSIPSLSCRWPFSCSPMLASKPGPLLQERCHLNTTGLEGLGWRGLGWRGRARAGLFTAHLCRDSGVSVLILQGAGSAETLGRSRLPPAWQALGRPARLHSQLSAPGATGGSQQPSAAKTSSPAEQTSHVRPGTKPQLCPMLLGQASPEPF